MVRRYPHTAVFQRHFYKQVVGIWAPNLTLLKAFGLCLTWQRSHPSRHRALGQLGTNISLAYTGRVWEINLHPDVEAWFLELCRVEPETADLVAEAIDVLAEQGPALGRPLVDRLKGSQFHNMKELRPGSAGATEVRMIFAFDPLREAIFLVAGDKSGQWQTWYNVAIPLADSRFEEHLIALKEGGHD